MATILADPGLFGALFDGMLAADLILRMRCADTVEKITLKHPEYLRPYKTKLIQQVAKIDQQEVRWHVAQLLSRLVLDLQERHLLLEILSEYLKDESKIIKAFSMQALADIAEQDAGLRTRIVKQLQ